MRISRLFLSKIGRKSLVPADRKEFIMKIVVLAGGISTERDVSLVSGMGIYKALKSKGHQVMLLDVFLGYEHDDRIGRRTSSALMSSKSVSTQMLCLWHCMVRMVKMARFRHVLI